MWTHLPAKAASDHPRPLGRIQGIPRLLVFANGKGPIGFGEPAIVHHCGLQTFEAFDDRR